MVKTRRKRKLPVSTADYGPPERHQRGEVELIAVKMGAGNAVQHAARNKYEHVLDRLVSQKIIDRTQHEAGMRIRGYWERATLLPQKLAMDMGRTVKGHSEDTSLAVINASSRLAEIRDNMTATDYELLIAVCGHGESPTNAAPRNRAIVMFTDAINVVVRVWRMR